MTAESAVAERMTAERMTAEDVRRVCEEVVAKSATNGYEVDVRQEGNVIWLYVTRYDSADGVDLMHVARCAMVGPDEGLVRMLCERAVRNLG